MSLPPRRDELQAGAAVGGARPGEEEAVCRRGVRVVMGVEFMRTKANHLGMEAVPNVIRE